jgi:hypothetical protein
MKSVKSLLVAVGLALAPAAAFGQAAAPAPVVAPAPAAPVVAAPVAAPAEKVAEAKAEKVAAPAPLPIDPEYGQPHDGGIGLQAQVTKNGERAAWMHNAVLMPVMVGISILVLRPFALCHHPVSSPRESRRVNDDAQSADRVYLDLHSDPHSGGSRHPVDQSCLPPSSSPRRKGPSR